MPVFFPLSLYLNKNIPLILQNPTQRSPLRRGSPQPSSLNPSALCHRWKWKWFSCVWLFATPWTVHGILQARISEWAAFCYSRGSSQARDRTKVSGLWVDSSQLSHKGRLSILEWVTYPFSSRSSWPRNWTAVFCIAGRFFTIWALSSLPVLSVWDLLLLLL